MVPGLISSNIYILDTKPDPLAPKIVKTIQADEVAKKAGYSRPHTVHCGPNGIYLSALGDPKGDGPGGLFVLDHDTMDVLGRWQVHRVPQYLCYDFWWHLGYDVAITSEWGTPDQVERGLDAGLLAQSQYGHKLHLWDLKRRRHLREIGLEAEHQMVLEVRPAHDPTRAYGFVRVVVSLKDLSASVWLWELRKDTAEARKVIEIPAQPAEADLLSLYCSPWAPFLP